MSQWDESQTRQWRRMLNWILDFSWMFTEVVSCVGGKCSVDFSVTFFRGFAKKLFPG
jgi:hypothetical protein